MSEVDGNGALSWLERRQKRRLQGTQKKIHDVSNGTIPIDNTIADDDSPAFELRLNDFYL